MMKTDRRAVLAALLMLAAAAGAHWLAPTHLMSKERVPAVSLDGAIPDKFGDWRIDTYGSAGVVNPQQGETLKRIYSQTLSRTYVNRQGHRVMLSIVYGEDQRDSMAVHYPEVCYPAQGFEVLRNRVDALNIAGRQLPVRRLLTKLGDSRPEPVTYWTTVGNELTLGGADKKRIELHYGLRGIVPDGMLFRVSSIGANSEVEFAIQDDFIRALLAQSDPGTLRWLVGQN
ncbi:exosortase-associated protein EpsI, B-type [Ideonella dechloratans]|uniref:exosortase-associated protein EpsI, B-type n=1 Tax=Ideonella dechloratans TaxID=36863 RepID=UPI0035B19CCB